MELKPGDIVQLKSRGPTVRIERIVKEGGAGDDTVSCTWFENTGNRQQVQREAFDPALLDKCEFSFADQCHASWALIAEVPV